MFSNTQAMKMAKNTTTQYQFSPSIQESGQFREQEN